MDGGGEEAKERNPGKAFVVFSMKPQKTNDASYIKVLQYPAFYVFSVTKSISRKEIKNKIVLFGCLIYFHVLPAGVSIICKNRVFIGPRSDHSLPMSVTD